MNDPHPQPELTQEAIFAVTKLRKRRLRSSALIGLAGAGLSVLVFPWLASDMIRGFYFFTFGVIAFSLPFLVGRYFFWKCPVCNFRLDLFLENGLCPACSTRLESETPDESKSY